MSAGRGLVELALPCQSHKTRHSPSGLKLGFHVGFDAPSPWSCDVGKQSICNESKNKSNLSKKTEKQRTSFFLTFLKKNSPIRCAWPHAVFLLIMSNAFQHPRQRPQRPSQSVTRDGRQRHTLTGLPQQHKHHAYPSLRYCRREFPRPELFLPSRSSGSGHGCCLAVGSGRLTLSKLIIILGVKKSKQHNASESPGLPAIIENV